MAARVKKPVDPASKLVIEQVGVKVVAKLRDVLFEIEGTPLLAVKYRDNSFKKKPVVNVGLFLANIYVGAKGTPIFCFTPEDAQEWVQVELEAKQLDEVVPLFGAAVAEAFESRGEAINQVFGRLVSDASDSRAEKKQAEVVQTAANYSANPNFGRF